MTIGILGFRIYFASKASRLTNGLNMGGESFI